MLNYDLLNNKYPKEVEYLYITHLLRTTSMRFLDYKDSNKYLERINNEIKDKFPDWRKNKYYKKSSIKLKIICNLAYNKQYFLLKLLTKLK